MDRKQMARDNLRSVEARAVFDQIAALYPDASFFWDSEDSTAEIGIGEIPHANGLKSPKVSITIF